MKGKILTISVIVVVAALITIGAAFVGSQLVFAQGQSGTNNIFGNIISQVVGGTAAPVPAVKGLVAVYVNSGGPADTAGVKRGDIILKINSTEVNTSADVKTALTTLKPGDMVALTLTHGDAQKQMDLKLGDRSGSPDLGMTLVNGAKNGFGGKMFHNPSAPANGALVVSVDADSPASTAGLKQGDVILSIDGTVVTPASTLANQIAAHKSGDKITLKVHSGATSSDVAVTLSDKSGKAYLGIQYRQPFESNGGAGGGAGQGQPMPRFRFGAPNGVLGLVVNSVVAGGPADKAGVKAGDVVTKLDGNAVTNANDFIAALAAKKVGDTVTLSITHQGSTQASDVTATLGENPQTAGKAYLGVSISDGMMPRFKNGGGAAFPALPVQPPAAPSTGSSS